MLPVAVLAGGAASRLRPLTETTPKSLVEVAGKPFVVHQLNLLRREGVERVVLCVGHLGDKIKEFVGDGANFGLQVAYSFDGPQLLGTAGALRRALPLLGDAFFVLYGDSYLDIVLRPIELAFRRHRRPALMTVFRNEGRWDTSNVVFDGARIVYHDKRARRSDTRYIDYGLGVLTAGALAGENVERPFDLGEAYSGLAARDMLAGYEVFRRFYEIGTPDGLAETDRYLREGAMGISDHTRSYYEEVAAVAAAIDQAAIERMISVLVDLRSRGGRLFILGVGGGAGHAGHAVNDFRKICGIEAYAPTDNVSELTARINDDGWPTAFANWLRGSRIGDKDAVFVFSVGGGSEKLNVSANIVEALKLAKSVGAKVIGVVGRDGGYTREVADACVVVPTVNPALVTAHTEAFQAVVWHGIVSHPKLLQHEMKWEAVGALPASEGRNRDAG
jgi:D-sedoheptulose 7-phosphate isomerase